MSVTKLSKKSAARGMLIGLVLLAWSVYLSGWRQDLPYFANVDETYLVEVIAKMLDQQTLNPGWFGHPRSTIIYPLYFLSNIWQAIMPADQILYEHLSFATELYHVWTPYYLLARFITTSYGVLSVIFIYKLGRAIFDPLTGLTGAFLYIFYPLVITHTQLARSDSATAFWTLLSLYMLVRLYRWPSTTRQFLAGLSIGLAIATKYYLGVLVLLLITVDVLLLRRQKQHPVFAKFLSISIGLAAVGAAFVLSTPFFFIDFSTAWQNIIWELRPEHPAVEKLSPLGNFIWYVTNAIPQTMSPLQAGVAVVGILLLFPKMQVKRLLLLEFILVFLVGISQAGLHWQRWLFPILPILALLTAFALVTVGHWLTKQFKWPRRLSYAFVIGAVLGLSYSHLIWFERLDDRRALPDTRVLAGIWMFEHAPAESFVVIEEFSIPVGQDNYKTRHFWSVSQSGFSLEEAYLLGVNYVVVSSFIYDSFFRDPQRFPAQVAFYQHLFEEAELVSEFEPSETKRGPTIRIYRLTATPP